MTRLTATSPSAVDMVNNVPSFRCLSMLLSSSPGKKLPATGALVTRWMSSRASGISLMSESNPTKVEICSWNSRSASAFPGDNEERSGELALSANTSSCLWVGEATGTGASSSFLSPSAVSRCRGTGAGGGGKRAEGAISLCRSRPIRSLHE
ncbi:unnamed protein product [Ectocarpus sp. 12 AP-2014]